VNLVSKKIKIKSKIFSLLLLLSFLIGSIYYSQLYSNIQPFINKTITKIGFRGNKHVSDADLLELTDLRRGEKLSIVNINFALKKIMKSGSFSYARVEAETFQKGVFVRIIVTERPIVSEIEFIGINELNEIEIKEELPIKEDEVFTKSKISRTIEIILYKYREEGLFNAIVKVRKGKIDEKTNGMKITFLIDEGEDIKISRINLLGIYSLDPEDIRESMELEEDGIIADGTFKKDLFEKDKENIVNFYKVNGFLDAKIDEARWDLKWENKLNKDKRVIVITYKINEGEQFFFNGYSIDWKKEYLNKKTKKPLFNKNRLYHFFEYTNSSIGDFYDFGKFTRDKVMINQLYSQKGYIFARVIPEKTIIILNEEEIAKKKKSPKQIEYAKKHKDYYNLAILEKLLKSHPKLRNKKFVHTGFLIAEGNKGFIENIIIKGNKKTLTKVIKRELLVKQGQLFNALLVQRSRERVFNLGFFKEVNIDARPGSSEGQLNLIIDVLEQPTGTISLGGGYGTQTGFSIFTEISEKNLNGTGKRISGKLDFGPSKVSLESSWTQPYLFDKPWSLTLSGYFVNRVVQVASIPVSNTAETSTYEKSTVGSSIGIGHRFWVNWYHYHRIGMSISSSSNPSSLVNDSIYQYISHGWQWKNSFVNGVVYDTRDNVFNTTTGLKTDFSIELIGTVLGGDDHYARYNPKFTFYWWPMDFTFFNLFRKNILRRWRLVFEHKISMAFTQQLNPIYKAQDMANNLYIEDVDRLYLGGYESLRGWQINDIYYPTAFRGGGSHRILFGTELRIPVEPSLLWIVFFFEAGALYTDISHFNIDESTSEEYKEALQSARLSKENLSMSYFRYSYGIGFRLQIPILPLRMYLGKRLLWNPAEKWFRPPDGADEFEFIFGIGDRRF